ncbi:hypothetical protein [Stappia sp. TSB10GB4]|uniref:hypothetical protein n=1 Tax=Stappia sp. TSB10GB4 TaxID=2003584 RepID=UPI001643FE7E|nr:hypothetical protein [Stappia sp. TSB10GB4]
MAQADRGCPGQGTVPGDFWGDWRAILNFERFCSGILQNFSRNSARLGGRVSRA